MNFLIITKNSNGSFTIKDSISNTQATYYFYNEKQAIQQHRKNINIRYKHLTKIYI